MNLEIVEVQNPSHNDDGVEKVYFYAKKGENLKNYLLYDNTFTDEDELSNKGQHAYRFPTFSVTEDCYIALWIGKGPRKGVPAIIHNKGKKVGTGHRFFWNRKASVINNTGDKLTLVKIADQQVYEVEPE
jgi:hypothetical protein